MRQIFMLRQRLAERNRIPEALALGDIAIGWCKAQNLLTMAASRPDYRRELARLYPEKEESTIGKGAGNMLRFIHVMRRGDIVAVPDVKDVYLARLMSDDAFYVEGQEAQDGDDAFRRRVDWLLGGHPVPKKLLSEKLVGTLDSQHVLLQLDADDLAMQELLQSVDAVESSGDDLGQSSQDDVLRLVKARLEQNRFRRAQMEKHSGRCCISGCETLPALEAAHILPYANGDLDRNHHGNGLLLRADIHKLFDEYLISINPRDNLVEVSKSLWESEYRAFHGKRLSLDASFEKLQIRHRDFQSREKERPQRLAGAF